MGRWGVAGRNYGRGINNADDSSKFNKFVKIGHCKKCRHQQINWDNPYNSFCLITKLTCIEAIPICVQWKFKEISNPKEQPVYVAKH